MTTLDVIHRYWQRCRTVPYRNLRHARTNPERTRAGSVQPEDDGPRTGQPDALAGVPDAVYRLDAEGRFTYLNAAAEALLHHRGDDLLGRRALECFPATAGSLVHEQISNVLTQRQARQFEYFYEPQGRWY